MIVKFKTYPLTGGNIALSHMFVVFYSLLNPIKIVVIIYIWKVNNMWTYITLWCPLYRSRWSSLFKNF
jgi:hypothetical protein